jgi:serine/threonine protein kinase
MNDIAPGSRAGSQFGRYHLRRLLGRGGMGEVYEAADTVKERLVALKLLAPAFSNDPLFRERLQREAITAGRLLDPHVVPLHDFGEIDGQLFLEMRLIDGANLATVLQHVGKLDPPRAVAVVRQVAAALDAAHAVGVIHGDVKPQNILITRDDFTYLVDFGIANAATCNGATQVGSPVGTWKYTAPEWFADAEVTHRADVYALACVLHECLTGSPPYPADNPARVITAHLMQPIPRPSQLTNGVPAAFDDVVARGMAKDPQSRYATAGELALAAQRALTAPGAAFESTRRAPRPVQPPQPPSGPFPVPAADARAAPRLAPTDSVWLNQFDAFRLRREAAQKRRLRLILGAAAVVVLLTLAGVAVRVLHPSQVSTTAHNTTKPTSSTTTTAAPAAKVQAQLLGLLPDGYPSGACNQITPPKGALAAVSCAPNTDPDGPPSANYTLFADAAKLVSAFNHIVATGHVMECPGRIQSPGPWHHNATPDKNSGLLLCSIQQGRPTVTWTNDTELLLSVVSTDVEGPSIDQLYTWWMSHS